MNLTMYKANDPTFILGPSNYLMEIDRQKRTIQREVFRKDVKRKQHVYVSTFNFTFELNNGPYYSSLYAKRGTVV